MKILTCTFVGMVVVAAIWYAPYYLAYADKPAKADVVVLFVGFDYNARKKEAMKLLEDGYVQNVIVPTFGTIYGRSMLDKTPRPTRISKADTASPGKKTYPRYFEETHVEVLKARQIMERAGFRSAIFVSSPFHMRRIKMMAGEVFNKSPVNMRFVPTRYAKREEKFWLFSNKGIEEVANEYIKMIWFLAYRVFT